MSAFNVQLGFGLSADLAAYQFDQADIGKLVPDLQATILYRVAKAATGTAALAIVESGSFAGMLPLAGGTMTGTTLADLRGKVYRMQPDANAPANMTFDFQMRPSAQFDANEWDPVVKFGWNLGTDDLPVNTNYGTIYQSFEGNYTSGAVPTQEWHLYSVTKAGVSRRPFSYNGRFDVNGFQQYSIDTDVMYFGSVASQDIQAGASFLGPMLMKAATGAHTAKTGIGVPTGLASEILCVGANSFYLMHGGGGAGPDAALYSSYATFDATGNEGMKVWHGDVNTAPLLIRAWGIGGFEQAYAIVAAAAATGDKTQTAGFGIVRFAAGASTLRVTNGYCAATTCMVFAQLLTNDATARIANVAVAAGHFDINLTAAATAETQCCWYLVRQA